MELYCARNFQPLRPRAGLAIAADDRALDGLPVELLAAVTQFLDGFELLRLTHANARLRHELRKHPQLWTQRMLEAHASDVHHALVDPMQRYLQDTSLGFRGQDLDAAKRGDRCTCVPIERNGGLPLAPHRAERFSFDAWFSLLPNDEDPSILPGGIILGAQSVQWIHPMVWAHYHQQLLHVDKDRNLYCSVLNDPKAIVTWGLETERWYHVALTYDNEEQRVYLDGELVHFDEGELHCEWPRLEHLQIGTGCISGATNGKPTPRFCGWYGFHGLVDEFRVWDHQLEGSDVARLAKGLAPLTAPCYSLKDDAEVNYCGSVIEVKCARPREKYTSSLVRLEASTVPVVERSFWDFEWPLFFEDPPLESAATSSATSPNANKKRFSRRGRA